MSAASMLDIKSSDYRKMDFCRGRFYSVDFSGLDLSGLKMKYSLMHNCNFNNCNMSNTDCQGSEFFGSTFIDTNCYRTNFRDAKLANTIFAPKDAFGITVTLHCKSFENMRVPQLWYLSWLMLATMMIPDQTPIKENFKDKLIGVIGAERYVKLQNLLRKRNM